MEECSSDFINKLYTEYLPGVAKITIENGKRKKGRLYKEKENEFVIIMLRRVNKMQLSQSNWNFPDFPPVPLSKPELF